MHISDQQQKVMEEATSKLHRDEDGDLYEVCMIGGPPWGFNISGGCEFGTDLFVKKVSRSCRHVFRLNRCN